MCELIVQKEGTLHHCHFWIYVKLSAIIHSKINQKPSQICSVSIHLWHFLKFYIKIMWKYITQCLSSFSKPNDSKMHPHHSLRFLVTIVPKRIHEPSLIESQCSPMVALETKICLLSVCITEVECNALFLVFVLIVSLFDR